MTVSFGNLTAKSPSLYDVIQAPHMTEKSTLLAENGQYVFKVAPHATKRDVKTAVEALYKVDVTSVKTINLKGKSKRFRGRLGKRPGIKKAIVRVAAGQTIDLGAEV